MNFKLSNGYELPIVKGFREQIKPTWRKAYKDFKHIPITLETVNNLKKDMDQSAFLLSKHGIYLKDKKIMDAGCYLGIQCFRSLELGASEAVGIDIPEYYVNQALNNKDVDASKVLTQRRKDIESYHSNLDLSKIKFYDLSVFEMEFKDEFDIIFSWETFEHIIDPKEALKRIYNSLKPGGISFNQYNPFFCISGGHSMCTLDYPFAHVIMTNKDFKRYTKEIIPENPPQKYSELSYNFFTKNLNRMTQHNLKQYIEEAGFETLDFITLPEFKIFNTLDSSLLNVAKELYPTLTLNDLICSQIYFILRKPL